MSERLSESPHKKSVNKLLSHAGVIVTSATVLFYVIGVQIWTSYLEAFGISRRLFPLSVPETIYWGGKGLFLILNSNYVVLILIFSLCTGIVLDFANHFRSQPPFPAWLREKLEALSRNSRITRHIVLIFVVILVFMFFMGLFFVSSGKAGDFIGTVIRRSCRDDTHMVLDIYTKLKGAHVFVQKIPILEQSAEPSPIAGCVIACNTNQCAYIGTDNSVFIINNSDIATAVARTKRNNASEIVDSKQQASEGTIERRPH